MTPIFSVGTPEADPASRPVHCLSCGEDCGYVTATFTPSTANYLFSCRGPGVPYFHLRWTSDAKRSKRHSSVFAVSLVTQPGDSHLYMVTAMTVMSCMCVI